MKSWIHSAAPHKWALMMYACSTNTGRWRQEDQGFEVILGYAVSWRPAWNLISKEKFITKNVQFFSKHVIWSMAISSSPQVKFCFHKLFQYPKFFSGVTKQHNISYNLYREIVDITCMLVCMCSCMCGYVHACGWQGTTLGGISQAHSRFCLGQHLAWAWNFGK